MKLTLLLIATLLLSATAFKDCNFTQFDFFNRFSLGQLDELNRTFDGVNKKMQVLPDVTLKNGAITYVVSRAKAGFKYLDGRQTAEVIGNDIIYIKGGRAETNVDFAWSKNDIRGVGSAICVTDPITFAKLLYLDEGFMAYKLADFQNVSYYQQTCNITRLDGGLEPADVTAFAFMFNENDGSNVKSGLVAELLKYYGGELNSSFYDERQPITNHSEYVWTDPTQQGRNLTINYTLLPTGAHLGPNGLSLNFVTEITDDDAWKCGPGVPSQPNNLSIYGGIQQFLSMSIIENTVRLAGQKGVLNTQLNEMYWQSRVFQFFAGDLYEIIPALASKFYASEAIEGSCTTFPTDVKATIVESDSFSITLPYICSLNIKTTKISSFDLSLTLYLQAVPQSTYLDFKVTKAEKFAHFKDEGEFKIIDMELANLFLTRSLERLYQGKVFGSGWKIYARDQPKVEFQDGYMFIYDASGEI